MKNNFLKLLSLLLVTLALVGTLVACGGDEDVDFAASVVFDPTSSETAKQEVTVKNFVDGDTTHFYVPETISPNGVLKARYLGVNTPESTGQIQPWGKKASNFTKEKLSSATSIYIESEDGNWNLDSTGARHLVWIWYKPEGSDTYRNLNIELMQNGLSVQSSSAQTRYGKTIVAAYDKAVELGLNVHSTEKDPDFFYGEAVELTLRELRANITDYVGVRVAFEGVVAKASGSDGVYIEAYDEENDMYNGIYVYYGKTASVVVKERFTIGNRVHVVGKVSEFNGTYQVSDVMASGMRPGPNDTTVLDTEFHDAAYKLTDVDTFRNGKVEVELGDEVRELAYAELALGSSVSFENLRVVRTSTTKNVQSSNYMAFTLYCRDENDNEITIRTIPFVDENGNYVLAGTYVDKTISVRGVVEYYKYSSDDEEDDVEDTGFYYQIKVLSVSDITIID